MYAGFWFIWGRDGSMFLKLRIFLEESVKGSCVLFRMYDYLFGLTGL